MPVRPTYDGFSKESLLDPATLRERTDVVFREDTTVVNDRDEFNGRETWAGSVAVGVVDEDEVLLVNGPDGWTLPVSPVKAGDDWAAVARRWVAQKTGQAVAIDAPTVVRRTNYRLAGSGTRQTTGYNLVFRARPVDATTPMDYLHAKRANEDGDEWTAEWFERPPADLADDEFRADVEWFVGD